MAAWKPPVRQDEAIVALHGLDSNHSVLGGRAVLSLVSLLPKQKAAPEFAAADHACAKCLVVQVFHLLSYESIL
jgi:hypothetical protein